MYTDESWAKFTKALERAQANIDYTNINTTNLLNQLMTQLKSKYTGLWKAKEGLEVKTLNVTFNYKDSTGSDATLVLPVTYGEKLSDAQIKEINAKIVSYVDSMQQFGLNLIQLRSLLLLSFKAHLSSPQQLLKALRLLLQNFHISISHQHSSQRLKLTSRI